MPPMRLSDAQLQQLTRMLELQWPSVSCRLQAAAAPSGRLTSCAYCAHRADSPHAYCARRATDNIKCGCADAECADAGIADAGIADAGCADGGCADAAGAVSPLADVSSAVVSSAVVSSANSRRHLSRRLLSRHLLISVRSTDMPHPVQFAHAVTSHLAFFCRARPAREQ